MCGFLDIVFDKGFQDKKMAKMTGFVGVEVIFCVLSGSVKWSDCRLEFWMEYGWKFEVGLLEIY